MSHPRRFHAATAAFFAFFVVLLAAAAPAGAAEIAAARKQFDTGKYAECLDACNAIIKARDDDEEWWLLKIRAELTTGKYDAALASYREAIDREDRSVRLRLLGRDVLLANDQAGAVEPLFDEIRTLAGGSPWRYADATNRVAIGRVLLLGGADARQVLELFYDRAKKDSPESPDAWVAGGELALEKHDYALAAESFLEARKRLPDDPDVALGLARAYAGDSERATAALTRALELNPRHVESLLFQADNLIDREDYENATKVLDEVAAINAKQPRMLAYRAVMAHLEGKKDDENARREEALSVWRTNPEIDHLIGEKLSAKYRFAEGAAYQRRALAFDPNYRPAKLQLAQDLLRVGGDDEADGWRLAAEVAKEDPYSVVAYNLVTLNDALSKFVVVSNEHFRLRMDAAEAQIYGDRALRLLTEAKKVLCEKYGLSLSRPVVVEIFPQQKDFAIRTFGLPGGAGFLGVCFGNVITANSPASRGGNPQNWEAVLWHEFGHVVTLHLTKNKMPRWLSEGISVYEERLRDKAWGQSMNPQYREMVLGSEAGGGGRVGRGGEPTPSAVTPVSKLSGAFLKPPTPMHLQFAYFESSMVVEYVVERFGAEALAKILADLGDDVPINDALAKHTEPIGQLDENFAKWFKEKAESLGSREVDWHRPELSLDATSAAMAEWNRQHPNSFFGLLGEGRALIAEGKFKEALTPLEKAVALYPGYGEPGGPYALMAQCYRELGVPKQERAMLEKHAALGAEAIDARLRLIDMAVADKDWPAVRANAESVLAVNPLTPAPHRALAQAAEGLGDRALAIEAHRTLLLLAPLDLADHHFRLAELYRDENRLPEARRQVVMALEEAPRFRDAHRLLLEIAARMPATAPAGGDEAGSFPSRPATVPGAVPPSAPFPAKGSAPSPSRVR